MAAEGEAAAARPVFRDGGSSWSSWPGSSTPAPPTTSSSSSVLHQRQQRQQPWAAICGPQAALRISSGMSSSSFSSSGGGARAAGFPSWLWTSDCGTGGGSRGALGTPPPPPVIFSAREQAPDTSPTSTSSSSSSAARTDHHPHHQHQPGGGGGGGGGDERGRRDWRAVLRHAGARALGGGLPGGAAMVAQVLCLMWLRTTVNYQYRTGLPARAAMRALYADGGPRRFYQGVGFALLQGPLCRFGDTAANAGVLAVMDEYDATRALPVGARTAAASVAAGGWRMLLLPLDAAKTMSQVEGRAGLGHLWRKARAGGVGVLYHGAAASAAATFVGHLPWFTTYNYLSATLPMPDSLQGRLVRAAGIGFCAGVASDCCSNGVRVVKTTRQTARTATSYRSVVASIVAADGVAGLLTRGLATRVAANGLQNVLFTVLWQLGQDRLARTGLLAAPSSGGGGGKGAHGGGGG